MTSQDTQMTPLAEVGMEPICLTCRANPCQYDDESGSYGHRCGRCSRLTRYTHHTHTHRYTDDNRPPGVDPDHTWQTAQRMSPYFRHTRDGDGNLVAEHIGYVCDGPDGCGHLDHQDHTPAPRPWTDPHHPAPDIPMLDGRRASGGDQRSTAVTTRSGRPPEAWPGPGRVR